MDGSQPSAQFRFLIHYLSSEILLYSRYKLRLFNIYSHLAKSIESNTPTFPVIFRYGWNWNFNVRKVMNENCNFWAFKNLLELLRVSSCAQNQNFFLTIVCKIHKTEVRLPVRLRGQKAKPGSSLSSYEDG